MESNSLFSTSVAVDENCAKEPKVEYDFEMNPWSVEDASAFLKYCCPECDYQILDFEMFSWHALQNHAKSKVLFEVEKYDEKVKNYEENVTNFEDKVTNFEDKVTNYDEKVKPFECKLCNSKFGLKARLNRHIKEVHEKQNRQTCSLCGSTFSHIGNLNVHIASVHEGKKSKYDEEKPFKCPICNAAFTQSGCINRHIASVHNGKKTFKCSQCEATFTRKPDMNRHIASVHEGKKPYNCQICYRDFTRIEKLNNHILKVHEEGKETFKCSMCNAMFSKLPNLTRHFASVHEEMVPNFEEKVTNYEEKVTMKEIKMEIQSSDDFSLQNEEMETGPFVKNEEIQVPKNRKCKFCKIDGFDNEGLKAHLFKEHNFERKSNKEVKNCFLCLIAVSSKGLLREHLKEKHYSGDKKCCPYCDYKSLQSWQSLKYHIDYHHSDMREKKYFCDTCNQGFIFEDSVIIHKDTKHVKHVCYICGLEYTSASGLKEHMIIEHKIGSEMKNWICDICAHSAPTKKSLQIHTARKHAVDKHKKCPYCDYHSNAMHQMHVHIGWDFVF